MSGGKSGGTTIQTAELTPEQKAQIRAQTDFFTSTIAPAYQQAVGGAQDIYNLSSGGVTNAAQNQAAIAAQSQRALGETGESALRTGISGLENLFGRDYEAQQIQAALAPAQSQFQQNLAGMQAQFGGTGNLGSARQALAERQLAGSAQAAQQQAAAQVLKDISGQRLAAGGTLASLGQGGLGQAQQAAGAQVAASMIPQELYNKYASVIFGTPAASYNPDFRGTQGSTMEKTGYEFKI
jgi:hypothetical protein